MADDDAKKWLSCLGWGCLAIVVISVLGIGGCVAFFYKGGTDSHAVAKAYLDAVEIGDYDAAFLTLGPEFTERRSLDELVAFEQAARSETGSCGEWRMSGTSFNRENGRSQALLSFQRSCESGPMTISFMLEQVESGWVIQDIRYGEPVAPVISVCTGCSMAVPPGAKFCPSCGTEIGGETGDDELPSDLEPDDPAP
jgi:hypothetical protein